MLRIVTLGALAPAFCALSLLSPTAALAAETAVVQEILDGPELYIDQRQAVVKERARAPQQLLTRNSRGQIGFTSGAVGRLNRLLPKRQFILMGPGRWGSRGDIRLGVPVTYADISNAAILIEIARQKGGYIPDLSFGTHFFQDLVESNIRYLPLYPDDPEVVFNEAFFRSAPNALASLAPDFEALSDVLRVIDVAGASGGRVLRILMNGDLFQSLNPLYILLFAPLFAAFWPWLDKRNVNPSIPRKFALGLIQVALGFYVPVFAIAHFQNAAGLVPWIFLAFCYLLHTTGELCLSPIGLSMVTKLAAEKETGLAMGGWFLSIAMAQYMAGLIAAIASGGGHGPEAGAAITQYSDTYMMLFLVGLGFGVAYLVAAPLINKLMHGVK